ncbi:hypothetical protein EDB83DRAFT_2652792 [Lactarius deliciosus]|nr:hypothetical protein EDB83DRAFT_2652792 [Lactarius deliciosus]
MDGTLIDSTPGIASTDGWEGMQATIGDDDSPNPVMSELLPSVIEALPMWDVKRLEPPTLLLLLGPTVLPLTPTMGNVLAADAVKEDLACRFARVVVAPWSDSIHGALVLGEEDEEEGEPPAVAHRPWKDEIGVLVDPKLTDVFMAGMGLGAIWVEIWSDPSDQPQTVALTLTTLDVIVLCELLVPQNVNQSGIRVFDKLRHRTEQQTLYKYYLLLA